MKGEVEGKVERKGGVVQIGKRKGGAGSGQGAGKEKQVERCAHILL